MQHMTLHAFADILLLSTLLIVDLVASSANVSSSIDPASLLLRSCMQHLLITVTADAAAVAAVVYLPTWPSMAVQIFIGMHSLQTHRYDWCQFLINDVFRQHAALSSAGHQAALGEQQL
jgi:hypothetical protein